MSRKICPVCKGRGYVNYKPGILQRLIGGSSAVKACPRCGGSKWIEEG